MGALGTVEKMSSGSHTAGFAFTPPAMAHDRATAVPQVRSSRLVRWGTLVVLVAGPLGFGLTTTLASLVFVAVCWLLFLLWLVRGIRNAQLSLTTRPVMLPALLLLGFTAVHWVAGISVNPVASQLEWLRWVGYIALAVVAGESFVTLGRLKLLAATLAAAGLLVALLGLAQYLTGSQKIYWLIEPSQGGWIFGPYVNRNHFAGLMELWIPLALGLALMPENTFVRRWAWSLAALVMFVAVVFSGSRGGLLAAGVGAICFLLACVALRGGRRVLAGLVVALVLAGGAVWGFGRGQILDRYTTLHPKLLEQDSASAHRLEAWKGSLDIFQHNWVLGTGLGTFLSHFPRVRSFWTDQEWKYVHNDFLQFLSETGLVGVLLACWLIVAGAREAFRNLARTNGTATGALLVGLFCGCAGFLVHGWLDFNFHVPANAASFAVLGAVLTRRGWDED